ncbi:hypothetical protein ACFE04_020216 [Oxalis oulophora]
MAKPSQTPKRLLCAILGTVIFFLGLIFFILWLTLRTYPPRVRIQQFSILDFNHPNGFQHSNISFNVTVRNPNRRNMIHYGSTICSVFYKDQWIASIEYMSPFDQDHKTTTIVSGVFKDATFTRNSNRWKEFLTDLTNGMVEYRLELKSSFRFTATIWNRKVHNILVKCYATVGTNGSMLPDSIDKECHY